MNEGQRSPSCRLERLLILEMVVVFLLLTLAWGGTARAAAGEAGGPIPLGPPPRTETPLDFNSAVQIGLRQSPYLVKSTLEIDVRHLDEADARSAFIPRVSFRTRYYVNTPSQAGFHPRPYVLEFVSEGYNPVEAYFSLKVQKLLTKIAILGHHEIIARGLLLLGQNFLELDTLQQLTGVQEDLVKLGQENLAYLRQRLNLGETTPLEVQVASQELQLAQIEKERLISSQARLKETVRSYLGLGPDRKIDFDLKQGRQQVLGSFDAEAASLNEARIRSFQLKILAVRKELQAMKVMLAKARILPTLIAGVQTPDPLSLVEQRDFFFSLGLSWPIWDGFQRVRDITRQKTILKQCDAEAEEKNLDLNREWGEARENFLAARGALKLTQAKAELALLKRRQNEIRYQANGEPFSHLVAERKDCLEALKSSLSKTLDCDKARLNLRYLSGDLIYSYVDESSWKN